MRAGLALVLAVGLIASPASAGWKSKHVDGVIAAVDGRPITLSQVRARAKPLLAQLHKTDPQSRNPGADEELMVALVDRMITERLIQADTDHLRLETTSEDIDKAIKYVAEAAKLTPKELLAQAEKMGLSELEYRDELRRQIVEARWERQRVTPGVTKKAVLDELAVTYHLERDLL